MLKGHEYIRFMFRSTQSAPDRRPPSSHMPPVGRRSDIESDLRNTKQIHPLEIENISFMFRCTVGVVDTIMLAHTESHTQLQTRFSGANSWHFPTSITTTFVITCMTKQAH